MNNLQLDLISTLAVDTLVSGITGVDEPVPFSQRSGENYALKYDKRRGRAWRDGMSASEMMVILCCSIAC